MGSGVEVVVNSGSIRLERRPFSEWWLTATGVRMMRRSEVFCGLAWSAPQICPLQGCTMLHHPPQCAGTIVNQGLQVRRDLRQDDGLRKLVTNHQNCHILNLITRSGPPFSWLNQHTYYIYLIICVRPYAYGGVRPCALTQLSAKKWPPLCLCQKWSPTFLIYIYIYKHIVSCPSRGAFLKGTLLKHSFSFALIPNHSK